LCRWRAVLAISGDTLRAGSRAGYRGFFELRGRGKGERSGKREKMERGFDRTRVGLSRGEVSVLIGVLGREISANPYFLGRTCNCLNHDPYTQGQPPTKVSKLSLGPDEQRIGKPQAPRLTQTRPVSPHMASH